MPYIEQDAVSKYADPNCTECSGTGWIDWRDEKGYLFARYCKCFKRGKQISNLTASGLTNVSRYTLDSFEVSEPWQEQIKQNAKRFVEEPGIHWFFVGGQPGAGKTHICTGICIELIRKGDRLRYEVWPNLAGRLKTFRNEEEYIAEMRELKNIQTLYIDDLFKGKISSADKQIAWEIINARYAAGKKTIISSELHSTAIDRIDEAISSRIIQMATGYVNNLRYDQERDFRKNSPVFERSVG